MGSKYLNVLAVVLFAAMLLACGALAARLVPTAGPMENDTPPGMYVPATHYL